ncbi:hypothetical protein PAMP_011510 [Pampus punctatissimus]
MGAVLSWFAAHLCALVLDTAYALTRWKPQEALRDSPKLSEGLVLEEGDLSADSLEWCERSIVGGDTSDEYFDSRSWHSNTLSDVSPDAEDSLDALLGLEDTYVGRRATCGSFQVGQSKTRRRESVFAKDDQRNVTETYVRSSNCNWKKSPENPVDPDIPLTFSTRDLCSAEIQPHMSTETLKLHLHQDQSSLEAVCTDTEVNSSTELYSLHVQSQHKIDTFDIKVTTPPDTHVVNEKLQTQLKESNPITLTETANSETCAVHIDTTQLKTVETQQWLSTHQHESRLQTGNTDRKHIESTDRQTLEICNVKDVKVENIELLSTYYVEKNPGSHRCNRGCNDRHHIQRENIEHQGIINEDKEIEAIKEDKTDLCKSVGRYCNGTNHKIDSQLIKEFVVASPNITEAHGTKTDSVSHNKRSDIRDTLDTQINVLAHKVDICYSQSLCEESPSRRLSEIHHQVCTSVTKPQDKAWVSGVCFQAEQCGCVGTTTERTKPAGTVNEICSSITFSTETTACFPLDNCATDLTVVPKVSKLALPVPLAGPDREELIERQPDKKQPQCARSQPWEIPDQTKDLIPNCFNEVDTAIEKPTHRQLYSVDKVLERAQSGSIEPGSDLTKVHCDCKGSEECLPHHPFSNNLLFFSCKRGVEDTPRLLSENLRGEKRRVESPCSLLWQNKKQEGEGSHVYLDQQQDLEAVSKINLAQPQLGTTKLSEQSEQGVIYKPFFSEPDAYFTQHVPNKIGKTSTCPADTASTQNSSTEHPGVAHEAISPTNIETIVSTISSLYKQVQQEQKIPESPCGLKASLSLLSDSNNNTKASIKGVARGEGLGCFLGGAQRNLQNSKKIIYHLVTPTKVTSDPLEDLDKPQEDSEVSLSSLDYRANWSSEKFCPRKDLDNHCHLNLVDTDELGKLKTATDIEENTVANSLDSKCSKSKRNEGLKHFVSEKRGLLIDSEFKEEKHYFSQPEDHSLPNRRRSSPSESFEEYSLTEECREHTQVSVPASQQGVSGVRYSQPDVSLNLLSVSILEPILEADRSLENCCTTVDDLKVETKKEHEIMRPAEEVRDVVNLSGDISSSKSPLILPEQEERSSTSAELEPELKLATVLRSSSERRCRPMTVAYHAVSYTSTSSNFDEMDDPQFAVSDRNANSDKLKKSKTKGNQTGNKGSKFSVFTKMPSFRKAKCSKSSKNEEAPPELSVGGGEGLLPEQGPQGDNSDDEVFVKGDILNQTVHQASSSVHYEIEEDGFFSSTPRTCHVRQLVSQGSNGEGDEGPSTENPLLMQVQSPNGQTYKRSKSNDSLNIRMRFAQAHKSLSSLFESRSMDKVNEEQANVGIDGDSGKAKQSWRKLKKAREAELLKRTMSVPDGECSSTASGQDHRDLTSNPFPDRFSNPGSPSSLRAHTDPISKRGVPQGSGKENPHGCKSEGQRRKLSPNGLPFTPSVSGLPPFLDYCAVPQPSHTSPVSPLSPCSLDTLTHQHLPPWTRSHPVANESSAESPLRPMSPKPNSPRPAAQRKVFHYPHSARASSVSSVLLCQSVSVEGLTDPPQRPKTLKPSASPLGLSLSPVDAAEGRVDSQSRISIYAIGSISELEGTENGGRPASQSRARRLLEAKGDGKVSVVLGGLKTGCWVDVGHDGGGKQQRQKSSDDLWIEEQKNNKRKLAKSIRGSLGQLNTLLSEDMDKTHAGVTLGPVEAFRGMPLKSHCFSQSTPIGLDCLGWRRHTSYSSDPSECPRSSHYSCPGHDRS